MSQPVDTAYVEILPDFAGFAGALKRDLDGALRGLVGDIDRAFGAAERAATEAGREIGDEIEQGSERAERSVREFARDAKGRFASVQRDARQTGTEIDGIGGVLKKIGWAAAGAAAVAGLGAIATSGLKAAASLEQTQIAFNSLVGSAEQGKIVFDGLKEFAAATPFELGDITGTAQRFLAFNDAVGLADAELQPFLTTLGDIASVTSAGAFGMERVTLALGQIASRGKVSLEEINQISEALPGFSGVAAIASATGMSTADTMDAISAGAVSAEVGVAALLEGMQQFPGAAGAMEAQSATLLGVFSTFKDTLSQALAGAFEPVIPALKSSLDQLTPILGDAVSVIAPEVGGALFGVIQNLMPLLEPLAKIIGIVLRALSPFLNIIGTIAGVLATALVPVFEELEPVISELSIPILDLVLALVPLIPVLADILVAVIAVAAPLLKLVGIIVSFLSQKAIVPLVTVLAEVLGFLAEAVRQFGVWLTTVDWGAVLTAIGQFFIDLWDTVSGFFVDLFNWLLSLNVKVAQTFLKIYESAKDALIKLGIEFVMLPGKILKALGNLGSLLIEKGKDLIRGLWSGISSLGGWLWDKVTGFVSSFVIDPIKDVLGIASPSRVMADEVGHEIPAGIVQGAEDNSGGLAGLIAGLLGTGGGGDGAGVGGGMMFGPGSIIIQFSGVVPTNAEAVAVGEAVGAGINRSVSRRDTASAIRMM